MKKLFLLFFLLTFCIVSSQEETISTSQSASIRTLNSIPSYNLSKIEKMISKLKSDSGEEGIYTPLPDRSYDKLSDKEKFTYIMIHPENKSKDLEEINSFSETDNKIFGYLPYTLEKAGWSERQQNFLKSNKALVVSMIKEAAAKDSHIGLNYKLALEKVYALEMIPFLVDFYTNKDPEDKDILTVLMLLVKKSKYYPFTRSNMYRDLYGDNIEKEQSYVEYSKLNEEYIIKTATNLYSQAFKR